MRRIVTIGLTACVAAALAACDSSSSRDFSSGPSSTAPASTASSPSAPSSTTPSSTAPASTTPTDSPSASTPSGSASSVPVPGGVITDTELGDSITVLAEVRGLPSPYKTPGETVAVQVRIVNGTKFGTGIAAGDTALLADGQQITSYSDNPLFQTLLRQHGLQPVIGDDIDAGTTTTGWIAFLLDTPGTKPLKFQYLRSEIKVVQTDEVIPAKTVTVDLPV